MNFNAPPEMPEPFFSRLRLRALGKILIGLLGIYLLWPSGLYGAYAKAHDVETTLRSVPAQWLHEMAKIIPEKIAHWVLSIPFLVVGIGLLELVSNRAFWRLALAWDEMKPTTREKLILLIFALLIAGIALALHLTTLRARAGGW